MITMKTGGRTPVRFVFSDDVSETTVTIQPDDPPDEIAAKLRRVLELEGMRAPSLPPGVPAYAAPDVQFTPADRAATEERLKAASPMGWGEGVDIEDLPEA